MSFFPSSVVVVVVVGAFIGIQGKCFALCFTTRAYFNRKIIKMRAKLIKVQELRAERQAKEVKRNTRMCKKRRKNLFDSSFLLSERAMIDEINCFFLSLLFFQSSSFHCLACSLFLYLFSIPVHHHFILYKFTPCVSFLCCCLSFLCSLGSRL